MLHVAVCLLPAYPAPAACKNWVKESDARRFCVHFAAHTIYIFPENAEDGERQQNTNARNEVPSLTEYASLLYILIPAPNRHQLFYFSREERNWVHWFQVAGVAAAAAAGSSRRHHRC